MVQINPLFMILVSQEVRIRLMLLLDNSWDGEHVNTDLHSGSLSLPSKPMIPQAIGGRAWTQAHSFSILALRAFYQTGSESGRHLMWNIWLPPNQDSVSELLATPFCGKQMKSCLRPSNFQLLPKPISESTEKCELLLTFRIFIFFKKILEI